MSNGAWGGDGYGHSFFFRGWSITYSFDTFSSRRCKGGLSSQTAKEHAQTRCSREPDPGIPAYRKQVEASGVALGAMPMDGCSGGEHRVYEPRERGQSEENYPNQSCAGRSRGTRIGALLAKSTIPSLRLVRSRMTRLSVLKFVVYHPRFVSGGAHDWSLVRRWRVADELGHAVRSKGSWPQWDAKKDRGAALR